jgi:hypothetical protein
MLLKTIESRRNVCLPSHMLFQVAHWQEHQKECNQMAQQMAKASNLADYPFTFTAQVTQRVRAPLARTFYIF